MTSNEQNPGAVATIGAVIAAILSSACCWLPLLLLAFGVSGGVMAATFESLRPWLLPVSLVLLAVGWYFTLRPVRLGSGSACASDGESCCPPASGHTPGRRFNLTMLVIATVMVGVFAFFPNYLGALLPAGSTSSVDQKIVTIVGIQGMTCAGCEVSVGKHLAQIPGVTVENVDHISGQATVHSSMVIADSLLIRAVKDSGYRFTGTKQSALNAEQPPRNQSPDHQGRAE